MDTSVVIHRIHSHQHLCSSPRCVLFFSYRSDSCLDRQCSDHDQSLYTPQPFVKKKDRFKFQKILHQSQIRTQHVRNLQSENDTKCCLTFSLITPLSSNPSMNRHGILTKNEVLRSLNSLVLFQLVKRREYRPLSKNTQPYVTIKTNREKPRSCSRTD